MRAVLHALKYRGATCVMADVAEFLGSWRRSHPFTWPWAGIPDLAVQPLVGAPQSVRRRGFDQAGLLAEAARRSLAPQAAPVSVLARRDGLMPQAKLAEHLLRRANASGVFALAAGAKAPAAVLLVDDVVTTGATMAEAARVLRAAGTGRVFGFALALGA